MFSGVKSKAQSLWSYLSTSDPHNFSRYATAMTELAQTVAILLRYVKASTAYIYGKFVQDWAKKSML